MAVSLAAAPGAVAQPAGFDLFETDPAATKFRFRQEFTIPAGFFAPDSQPFEGDVHLGGVPLNMFQGNDVGDADTIVRRTEPADLPAQGATDMVPIELVMLSLVSVEPITVRVGGGSERWNVGATLSPSRPSTGQMTITRADPEGGTFDSFFEVYPLITFERVSDGMTRTIDVGALPLSQRSQEKLRLRAEDTPWRAGCVAPALAVRGLNDDFCPSFTPDEEKVLTVEQGQLAQHGIRPAQPRVEHFKCYAIRPLTPFKPRRVQLVDQFGAGRAGVLRPVELCNPVRKNREPLRNRDAHLKCYAIRARRLSGRSVVVHNQFGPDLLTVTRPRTLCVPSAKRLGRRRRDFPKNVTFTDHFKCYDVRSAARFRRRAVLLRDQFHRERARVLRPVRLCAPVQKNRERVQHPVRHLVCYLIRSSPRLRPRLALVRNQFGTELVLAVRPRTLCVPSIKLRLPIPVQPPPPPDPPLPPPPPPDQPPGPCTGLLQRPAPNPVRWSFTCSGQVTAWRIVVTSGTQIFQFMSEPLGPAGATCQITTTATPNDTLACTGTFGGSTDLSAVFETNPPLMTGDGAAGTAINGTAQSTFNFVGPNP